MSIQNYLNQIKNAVFGKDVRQSIHDAIKQCYDDASINHDNANMEVKLARGSHDTLNERFTSVEENIKNNSEQLDKTKNELNNRMDEFIAVGETSDNAETVDIRVGADGTVYKSAGTAVRTQVTNLDNKINNNINNTEISIPCIPKTINTEYSIENSKLIIQNNSSNRVNLLQNTFANQTVNGVTIEVDNLTGIIKCNGTAVDDVFLYIIKEIEVRANETYFFSGSPIKTGCDVYINFKKKSDSSLIKELSETGAGISYTFTQDCTCLVTYYIRIFSGISVVNTEFKPMITKTSTKQPYTPYSGLLLYKGNKNLLNNTFITTSNNGVDLTKNEDGSITANGTATNNVIKSFTRTLSFKSGETITISGCPENGITLSKYDMYISIANSLGTVLKEYIDTGKGVNHTFDVDGNYIITIFIRIFTGYSCTSLVFKPMVEYGNVKTDYIQYKDKEAVVVPYGKSIETTAYKDITNIYTDYSNYLSFKYNIKNKEYIDSNINEIKEVLNNVNLDEELEEYSLPKLYLTGDMTGISKDVKVTLNYKYNTMSGTCTLKWQGSSSLNYPKKNFTINFDNKFEAKTGWGLQKKYCLKANYIDFSHARNVVSAKLWGQVVKSRTVKNEFLYNLPNGGAIDGFPVMLFINNEYYGLYTFNIPKDQWMFGMTGANEKEAIITAEAPTLGTQFAGEVLLDGTDFDYEYNSDNFSEDDIKTSINNLVNACINANSQEAYNQVLNYVDIDSAIDYYIFTCLIGGTDCTTKNYILYTIDGVKWGFSAYDMDSTYGNDWSGKKYWTTSSYPYFTSFSGQKLMSLIDKYDKEKLKARYAELRNNIMSEDNVMYEFYNFCVNIPRALLNKECELWKGIPGTNTNNIGQVMEHYRLKAKKLDEQISKM